MAERRPFMKNSDNTILEGSVWLLILRLMKVSNCLSDSKRMNSMFV